MSKSADIEKSPLRASKLKIAAVLLLFAGFIWLGGYGCFLNKVYDSRPQNPQQPTEAIIVLTGGSLRVNKGLDLLAAGQAEKLFISGVNSHVTLREILELWKRPIIQNNENDCCIILGHKARNTLQNAQEAQQWVATEKIKTIRLVTSDYHMPRAILEFRKNMPDVEIIPWPIKSYPAALNKKDFLLLTFEEYNKTLLTHLRMNVLFSWMGLHLVK